MESGEELRRNRVHASLLSPLLFLGGERELSLCAMLLSVALVVLVQSVVSVVLGLVLWFASIQALRWMARRDPQFSRVYRRALGYRLRYPPSSSPQLRLARRRTSRWEGL